VPGSLRSEWGLNRLSALYLSIAVTNTKPGPRQPPKDPNKKEEDEKQKPAAKKPAPKPPPKPREPKEKPDLTPVDLTVELVDAAGTSAKLPLSRFGIARHPLDARIYRRAGRDAQRFTNIFELVAQTFVLPLSEFAESTPAFNPQTLTTIRLVFDKTVAGTIIVEHIGLSTPGDPAFLAAPVR
jgi:hypothetical protein